MRLKISTAKKKNVKNKSTTHKYGRDEPVIGFESVSSLQFVSSEHKLYNLQLGSILCDFCVSSKLIRR